MIKKIKDNLGFTLIEVIIYIALFSLLLGTAFVAAYQLIDGSGKLGAKNTIQDEGSFVMRKINWVLTGVQTIDVPTSGNTSNLRVTKYGGSKVEICLDANEIKIHEGTFGSCSDSSYLPLTTENVIATDLQFSLLSPTGIQASFRLDGLPFTITKYIRK